MNSDSASVSDASNQSSSPPPSPTQQSPSTSVHAEPSLQRLTTHFVTAKRSLSTTQHVSRANELVTSSRSLVEDIAVLTARNEYARLAAEDGVRLLEDMRFGIEKKGDGAEEEFTRVIEGLDEANGRLMKTLKRLEGTVVDAALQRKAEQGEANEEDDHDPDEGEGKTLLTFIDPSKHETLQTSLRAQIDGFNAAREDLSKSIEAFGTHIHILHSMLSPPPSSPEPPPRLLQPALYDEPPPTIPQLFHSITVNAATMAGLLQSLVSHYDLCVAALKHTEGGGEAAKRAVQQSPAESGELPKSKENMEESLYRKDHAAPISADERREMLRVVEHDSEEVNDVVSELGEHARELESAFDKLAARARKAKARDRTLRKVLSMLHEMQEIHLPSHLYSLHTFEQDWARIKTTITESTGQISDLSDFYADFFEGYRKLLREVERRKAAEMQMKKTAEKASREIARVADADAAAREVFMHDVGSVLPGDLWPSLHAPARRWKIVEVDSGEVENIDQSRAIEE